MRPDRLIKPIAAVALIACCWGIYFGFRLMMGDVNAYQVRYAMEDWDEASTFPTDAALSESLSSINTALSWDSSNPEYLEIKARLLYYQALNRMRAAAATYPNELFIEAASLHRKALETRPTWPYSWANLALMKSFSTELDDEFNQAVLNANKFGPWELPVQLTLAQIGARHWASLTPVQRAVIAANVHRSLRYQFKEVAEVLDAYQQRIAVCKSLPSSDLSKEFCGT